MLTREQVLALTGRSFDAAVAEHVFQRTCLGYYGPPADPTMAWQHQNSVRYDTDAEAEAAFQRYYEARYPDRPRGIVTPDDFTANLCWWKDGWGPVAVDEYDTDANDDYAVLCHVRDTWGLLKLASSSERIYAFHEALCGILRARMGDFGVLVGPNYYDLWMILYYRPGDYARAALLTLTESGSP